MIDLKDVEAFYDMINQDINLMKCSTRQDNVLSFRIFCKYSELWIRQTQSRNVYLKLITTCEAFNKELLSQTSQKVPISAYRYQFKVLWKKHIRQFSCIRKTFFEGIETSFTDQYW